MKNIVNLSGCLAAALLLSVSACVKDPKPETPHPPASGWLLTKIVASEVQGEPEGGPVYYSYTADEYEYNQHYKPRLHRNYYGVDSNHLALQWVDTLFYDSKLRPVRKGVNPITSAPYEVRYTYSGDSLYPSLTERYQGSTVYSFKYLYQDTIVYEISPHSDTTVHVYNRQGNYIGVIDPVYGFRSIYTEYDNHTNAARYLNLDFPVLNIPEGDRGPIYSANNWIIDFQEWVEDRQMTYDAEGKLSKSLLVHLYPTRRVTSLYYYTKPD